MLIEYCSYSLKENSAAHMIAIGVNISGLCTSKLQESHSLMMGPIIYIQSKCLLAVQASVPGTKARVKRSLAMWFVCTLLNRKPNKQRDVQATIMCQSLHIYISTQQPQKRGSNKWSIFLGNVHMYMCWRKQLLSVMERHWIKSVNQ